MRAGQNKLNMFIGEETVLERTVSSFKRNPYISQVIIVGDYEKSDKFTVVKGGETRFQSVKNGLEAVTNNFVLIHDGARPFVSPELIDRVREGVAKHGSAIPVIPITDSIRGIDGEKIIVAPSRENIVFVQTPQGFKTQEIRLAYSRAKHTDYTDCSEVYLKNCGNPHIISGEDKNKKLTTEADLFGLNARVGIGSDLHRLVPLRKLVLGGIEIASDKGTLAHSDGDAVIHALIDAILTAIGETDIGTHFPDTDFKFKDIDSAVLLSSVMEMLEKKNYKIINTSITIILDSPKLKDYLPIMKVKLANILKISTDKIGISCKTTEGTAEDTVRANAVVVIS